jgi:predicted amidohydrolase
VQFEHRAGDKPANIERIRHFTEIAAAQEVDVVVFPECCITGYWFLRHLSRPDLVALAEPVPEGPSCDVLRDLAVSRGIMVGAGLVERAADECLYNTYVVAMPDGRLERHRKLHCFVSEHMQSGDEFTVFDAPCGCRTAVLICYDNNIGENVRLCALNGAELVLAPHQTGGCRSTNPHTMGIVARELWDARGKDPEAIEREFRGPKGREWLLRWLPTRAHDNGVFMVFSNGVGIDDDEIRTGNAMIIDPYGRILAETWRAGDDIVCADLDGSLLAESTGRRWIKTRRPELYGLLAQPTGLEEDTRKVRFDAKGV